VAVDLDGTVLSEDDESPLPGATEALRYLMKAGWRVVVWTHRSDLGEVRRLLEKNRIPFDHINEDPETDAEGYSRKVFFDATVDDKAVPFAGNWAATVEELEGRRRGLGLGGEAKVRIMSAGSEEPVAVFSLRGGVAVEETGTTSRVVLGMMKDGIMSEDGKVVRPGDGEMFLKALSAVRGTYLWAEAH